MPKIYISDFFCTQCASRGIPIPRKKGREREPGHLKKLFCLNCGTERNFCEIKPQAQKYTYHQFLEEYYGNNFTSEGLRKQPYGVFKNSFSNEDWEKLQNLISELDN